MRAALVGLISLATLLAQSSQVHRRLRAMAIRPGSPAMRTTSTSPAATAAKIERKVI